MKIETHKNGNVEFWLTPEDDNEAFDLIQFLARTQKGQPVMVVGDVLTPSDRRGKVVIGVKK